MLILGNVLIMGVLIMTEDRTFILSAVPVSVKKLLSPVCAKFIKPTFGVSVADEVIRHIN